MRLITALFRALPIFLLAAAGLFFPGDIQAKQVDHYGREFWVTFMPNMGSTPNEVSRLRLHLINPNPVETRVTITSPHTGTAHELTLPGGSASAHLEVNLNAIFGDSCELEDFRVGNSVTGKSFLIKADADISVIGINVRLKSCDAFLALPAPVLRNHYFVLAYPNGYEVNLDRFDTPSGFAVIATEDDTRLDITQQPGVSINGRFESTFTVRLDKGQVFLGQASLLGMFDVSGTEISASHPVAVFAGTKRASNPLALGNFRDHMVEQIIPDEFWKNRAIAIPKQTQSGGLSDTTLYKVIAREAATITIRTNNVTKDSLVARGDVLTFGSPSPVYIQSTAPVLVAQYDPSQDPTWNGSSYPTDPAMTLIPSTEQWDTAYQFVSIRDSEFRFHFLDVIVPRSAAGTLRLDGAPIAGIRYPLDDTYEYMHITLIEGLHRISAAEPIGAIVYGSGEALSYAYPAGVVFSRPASAPREPGDQNSRLRLLAMPNPVMGNSLELEVRSATGAHIRIDVIDERGDVVIPATADLYCAEGSDIFPLNISSLTSGAYFCRVFLDDEGLSIVKFVVQR